MIKLLDYYHNFIIHLIYAYFTRYTIKSFLLIARLTLSSQRGGTRKYLFLVAIVMFFARRQEQIFIN